MNSKIIKAFFDCFHKEKQHHAVFSKKRRLKLEALESREMLSVTAADLQQIHEQYPELNFSDSINIIEVTASQLTDNAADSMNLRQALQAAQDTSGADLIVVRTTDDANTVSLQQGKLVINNNFRNSGDVMIVSLGSQPLTIDAGGKPENLQVGQVYENYVFDISTAISVNLAGLTLTGGYSTQSGGGIYTVGHMGELNLIQCSITGNEALGNGAGIYAVSSEGGINIINSTISNNTAGSRGAGIYFDAAYANLNITNSVISNNISESSGGGIFFRSNLTSLYIVNSEICGNTAGVNGGGIYNDSASNMSVIQSTIAGNSAENSGGGLYFTAPYLTLNNTLVTGNNAATGTDITKAASTNIQGNNNLVGTYTDPENLFGSGNNNIIGTLENPIEVKFVDAANGDYRLDAFSLAINRGDNNIVTTRNITSDLEGKSRIIGRYVDIGAYEFLEKPSTEVTTLDDIIDPSDGLYSLREAILYATDDDNVITFSDSLSGKTIVLNNQTDDYYPFYAELVIDKNIVIDGEDKNITIDADEKSRVFYVTEDATATFNNLTITGGKTADSGGAVLNQGTLTLVNNLIFGNEASSGGGVANSGTLNVTHGTIADNLGGGIFNSGTLAINNSIVVENSLSDIENAIDAVVQGHKNISSFNAWNDDDNYLYDSSKPLFENGSYKIAVASQAIDRGDDELAGTAAFDISGTTSRKRGNAVDVGAYESPYALPLPPTGLISTEHTAKTVALEWTSDPDDVSEHTFVIEYKTSDENDWTIYKNGYEDTAITLENLNYSTTYQFRIGAENEHGTRYTDAITVITAPTADVNFAVDTLTENSATLTWNSQNLLIGYTFLYYKQSDAADWTLYPYSPEKNQFPPETTSVTINGLDSSAYYDFKLEIEGEGGYAVPSPILEDVLTLPVSPILVISEDATTYNSITLTWAGQQNLTGYTLQYKTSDTETWESVALESDDESFVAENLNSATTYHFQIIATNTSGNSEASAIVSETTKLAPPVSPENFAATTRTTNSVTLEWDAQENLDNYTLEYKTSDTDWSLVATLAADAEFYTVTDLDASTNYDFRLTAINESSFPDSPASSETNAWTFPLSPSNFIAEDVTYSAVELAWDGDAPFEVYYTTDGETWTLADGEGDHDSYLVSDLSGSTDYTFRLYVYNENDDASEPVDVNVTTKANPPVAPESFEVTDRTTDSVTLVWAGQENLDGYTLEYKEDGANDWIVWANDLAADATSETIDGLAPSVHYVFRLTAENESGNPDSPASSEIDAWTFPATPADFEVTDYTYYSVELAWNENVQFDVYYTTDDDYTSDDATWILADGEGDNTSYVIDDLDASTTYRFRLRFYNSNGDVSEPVYVEVETSAAFFAPEVTLVDATYQSVELAWNEQENVSNYIVSYRTAGTTEWTTFAENISATSILVNALASKTAYEFQVTATDGRTFIPSEIISTTTEVALPVTPLITVISVSGNSVTLEWTGQNDNAVPLNYTLEYKLSNVKGWNDAYTALDIDTEESGSQTFEVTGLEPSTAYNFLLTVTNESGFVESYTTSYTGIRQIVGDDEEEEEKHSLIVTTSEDQFDANPYDNGLSLREAIDLVTKGKSNGLTLITFDTGINEVNLTRGELTITTAMTIQGENVIIDAQNKNRILTINAKNQSVELTGLTFTNGKASNYGGAIYQLDGNVTLIGVTLTDNSARYGGAYYQKAGTSELIQATFTDNTASYGGAFYLYNGNASFFGGENETETLLANNVGTWGGAIYQNSANTLLVLNQVSFVENEASWGGAIYQNAGTLGVDNTTFIGNKASWGGALHLSGAKVLASLNYVEFIGNQATWGGALYQSAGSLNIEYSSFSGNSATWGGSLYLSGANSSLTLNTIEFASNTATWGGGIYQSAGTLSVENSSLTDNRATYGGSLYLSGGSATLTDTDILPPSDLKTRYGTSIGKLNGSRLTIIKNSVTIYDQAIQAYLDDLDEV